MGVSGLGKNIGINKNNLSVVTVISLANVV